MSKTAGQAAYQKHRDEFWRRFGHTTASWENISQGERDEWEAIAAAAIAFVEPPEPTLGEIVHVKLNPSGSPFDRSGSAYMTKCQAAGEACARVGAERERREIRLAVLAALNREGGHHADKCSLGAAVLAAIDARGKP